MKDKTNNQPGRGRVWLAGSGLVGALGAFVGASCCVLPLILFNLGVSSAIIAQLGFFVRYRDAFMVAALGLLIISAVAFLRSRGGMTRRMIIIHLLAAFLICAAYIIPHYEGALLAFFGFREA